MYSFVKGHLGYSINKINKSQLPTEKKIFKKYFIDVLKGFFLLRRADAELGGLMN